MAKRVFSETRRPAIIGQLPSWTWRPASSSLKPRCRNARRKLPDCELPRASTQLILPATGLATAGCCESCISFLKNDAKSRNAAKPIPSTYGSCAVKTTWCTLLAAKPPFTQICVGSAVPGKGLVALQLAQAQSPLGIWRVAPVTPVIVSDEISVRVSCAEFRSTGRYGIGFECTMIGEEFAPLALMMRPITRPLMLEPSAFFATGTTTYSRPAAPCAVPPELSPCQPLLRPTSPASRRSVLIVMRPPRFGTSCHISPLALDMSIGLTMKNVAMYSTLPLTLGASSMSVMSALLGWLGSSSPQARPARVSYWPALPKLAPPKAGEVLVSITILVTRASAALNASTENAAKAAIVVFISRPSCRP